MNCPNCGTLNNEGSRFCIKCGNTLKQQNEVVNPSNENMNVNTNINNVQTNQQMVQNNNGFQSAPVAQPVPGVQPSSVQQNYNNQTQGAVTSSAPLNFIMYIIAILLKPIKSFKEEENKLNDSKNSIILSVIVAVVMVLANLIKVMISTVRVKSFSLLKGYTTTWNWSNLKELNYLNLIGKNFLMYAGAIVAIALTFFLASLIIKKEINFIKSLSIAATSVIPAVVGAMILSPILSLMYAPLGIIISVVGLVYSIIILYELVNTELKLEGEQKVYFNLICFGILGCMGYYAYVNLIAESVSSELSGLLDLFN